MTDPIKPNSRVAQLCEELSEIVSTDIDPATGTEWQRCSPKLPEYIQGLKRERDEARAACDKVREEREELQGVFDIQQTRMGEATKLWRESTGKHNVMPDLGDLLAWLMERADKAEAACGETRDAITRAQWNRDSKCIYCGFTTAIGHWENCIIPRLLSLDCGKGWTSPEERERIINERNRAGMEVRNELLPKIQKLRDALSNYATCSDGCTCGDGWSHDEARKVLGETK